MKILGGHSNDNDQLGIGGNAATGILLDGLDGDPATLDGPELPLLDAATEELRGQEVPEMKLAGGIRQIRADLMAAMRDLAEHDTQAVDIRTEIDEICVELVRLREKYGPGII